MASSSPLLSRTIIMIHFPLGSRMRSMKQRQFR
jgi:hypothetical protein